VSNLINPWAGDQTPTLPQGELDGLLAPDRGDQPPTATNTDTGRNLLFSLESPIGLWFWWLVAVATASLLSWASWVGYRNLRRTMGSKPHHTPTG
jgi:hypothetical protein